MRGEKKFTAVLNEFARKPELIEEANEYMDTLCDFIRKGYDRQKARKEIEGGPIPFDGAFEVAAARISVSGKFSRWNRLWLDSYSARYSTPESVASYRAARLSPFSIVDVGSGAGMQSLFFAVKSEVTEIEVSSMRVAMARLNAMEYGHRVKKFLNADYTDVINNIPVDSETVVFSDPLRPSTEEERSLTSLIPSPVIINGMLGKRTGKFVFDLPPQMGWNRISLEGEMEYTSINGSLNRLTLYMGELSASPVSAVLLPKGARVEGSPEEPHFSQDSESHEFAFMPDPSLIYSRLVHGLLRLQDFSFFSEDRRRMVLTSSTRPDTFFPGDVFTILERTDEAGLIDSLKRNDCGRVIPRFSLDPDKYYSFRSRIEKGLSGTQEIHIMADGGRYLVCKKDAENLSRAVDGSVVRDAASQFQ